MKPRARLGSSIVLAGFALSACSPQMPKEKAASENVQGKTHSRAVENRVRRILVAQLGVREEEVALDAALVDDLGADSLDLVELVMAIEEAFGLEIPDKEFANLKTVRDVISYLEGRTK